MISIPNLIYWGHSYNACHMAFAWWAMGWAAAPDQDGAEWHVWAPLTGPDIRDHRDAVLSLFGCLDAPV